MAVSYNPWKCIGPCGLGAKLAVAPRKQDVFSTPGRRLCRRLQPRGPSADSCVLTSYSV